MSGFEVKKTARRFFIMFFWEKTFFQKRYHIFPRWPHWVALEVQHSSLPRKTPQSCETVLLEDAQECLFFGQLSFGPLFMAPQNILGRPSASNASSDSSSSSRGDSSSNTLATKVSLDNSTYSVARSRRRESPSGELSGGVGRKSVASKDLSFWTPLFFPSGGGGRVEGRSWKGNEITDPFE